MATYPQRVVELAVSYAPMREIGTDDVLFNDAIAWPYFAYAGEWCDAFVSHVFQQLGVDDLIGGPNISTVTTYNWCKAAGLSVPFTSARLGDVVLYDFTTGDSRPTSHIEIMRADYSGDGVWRTVGGNTSSTISGSQYAGGTVALRDRSSSSIVGIFRPRWPAGDPGARLADLGAGCRGDRVETIQRAVGATVDGVYGPATREKVKAYQSAHGVGVWPSTIPAVSFRGKPKGFVDAATWARISPPAYADTDINRMLSVADRKTLQDRIGCEDVDGDFAAKSYARFKEHMALPETASDYRLYRRVQVYLNGLDARWVPVALKHDGSFGQATADVVSTYLNDANGGFTNAAAAIGGL